MPEAQDKTRSVFQYPLTKTVGLILLTLLYLVVCLIMVGDRQYLFWLLPPALLIIGLAFISIDKFFLLLLFLSPLSVQLRFLMPSTPLDLFLPTEPMLILLLFIVLYKLLATREFDSASFLHPLSIFIFISLVWLLISSLSGTNILVSLKFTLARTWFVCTFYLLALELFKKPGFRIMAIKALVIGMVPVILYHMVNLAGSGLSDKLAAHWATWPFFNDHTSFGAAIAFLCPVIVWLAIRSRTIKARIFYWLIFAVFICGLVFSYSRAAWLSLILASLFSLVYIFRISWKIIAVFSVAATLTILLSWSSIITSLESNKQDSSTNLKEHVQSLSNIRTDASNLERINRWRSALRMSAERPLLGWGPGTYQFEYAPYQYSYERTIISTNFGDGGNAHSEYLGALTESGIPALLFYVIILVLAFRSGHIVFYNSVSKELKYLALALMSGLFTYVIHGALNNFLDTDKISAPFWIFIACLVVLEMDLRKQIKTG